MHAFPISEFFIHSLQAQEFRRSWTTAVNNAEIIFENVNILKRDIQVRIHAFTFSIISFHLFASDFELFFAFSSRSIYICCTTYPATGNVFHIA